MHGESGSKVYGLWCGIKGRCFNKKNPAYKNYGYRGISMCREWADSYLLFKEWCLSNGYKEGLEIDREDNDKGYSPDNCRFVTRAVNARNKRQNKLTLQDAIDIQLLISKKQSLSSISRKYKVGRTTIDHIRTGKNWKESREMAGRI